MPKRRSVQRSKPDRAPASRALPRRQGRPGGVSVDASGFQLFFLQSPLPMLVFDPGTFRVMAANEAAIAKYGYSPGEFTSLCFTDLQPDPGVASRHRLKSGRVIDVDVVSQSIEFDGRPARLLIAQDISGRKRTEASTRALLQVGHDLAGILDYGKAADRVVSIVLELFQVRRTALYRLEPETNRLVCVTGAGDARRADWIGRVFEPGEGIIGIAMAEGRPAYSSDLLADARVTVPGWLREGAQTDGLRSVAAVALTARGLAIGTLSLLDAAGRVFSDDDLGLLSAFADQAALVLDNARLYEETERRLQQTETLLAVTRVVGSTPALTEVARRTTREMVRLLGADMGGAVMLSPERDRLLPVAGYRVPKELFETYASTPSLLDYPLVEEAKRVAGPIYAVDSQSDPRFDHPLMRLVPHKSVLVVPMWLNEQIVGGFTIYWLRERHEFTPDELRLVDGIARQAAVAAENARLLEAAESRRREAEVVADIVSAISASLDIDTVLHRVAGAARELCASDMATIALREPDTETMRFRALVQSRYGGYDTFRVEAGKGSGGQVMRTGQPFRTDNYAEDPRITSDYQAVMQAEGIVSQMVAPIRIAGRVEGLLYVHNRAPRPFSDHDETILLRLADHAALAVENARLFAQVRDTRDFLQSIAKASADGIITTDIQGRITYFSAGAEDMFGYRAEEMLGRSVAEFYRGGIDEARTVMDKLAADGRVRHYELPLRAKDGRWVEVNASMSLLRDADGVVVGTLGVLKDITERKTLEEQLRQSQKMDAVGRLAGGVAHDFNNLLTVILGRSELLLARGERDPRVQQQIELIRTTAQQGAALTGQLLAFSRKQVSTPSLLDLNMVVTRMEQLLRRLLGEDLALRIVLGSGLGQVKADSGQVDQVLMNLVVNARDAMPHGGHLTIETANVMVDDAYAQQHLGVIPGPYVMLAVSDTGCGMDRDTLSHIFEPFFTTKEPGKGTGLGLATVYGIVQQNGGSIAVYSEPRIGTTFRVYLPRVEELAAALEPEAALPRLQRGSETILLLEDEDGVLNLAREILEMSGYTILLARASADAIQIATRHPGPIHLLLTDVVMPQMNGREVAEQLVRLRSGMKVLYMSGYTFDIMVHHGVVEGDTLLLQKPFTLESLTSKVREVLDLEPGPRRP
jgi:PAS domain S-box-containing protein